MDKRQQLLADRFTIDHAEVKCIEEMAELQQVLCKYRVMALGGFAKAPDVDFRAKLVEELAHVKMRLDMLQYVHQITDEEIQQEQDSKLKFLCEMFDIKDEDVENFIPCIYV